MNISIFTLFSPRLEVMYLDEWISHHLMVGVDTIYLYNNGFQIVDTMYPGDGKTWQKKNYAEHMGQYSDQEINLMIENICKKYKNKVKLENWRYGIETGAYPGSQINGYRHCVENNKSDWWLFIDIDEFILSKNYKNINEFLLNQDTNKYGAFTLGQKLYQQRTGTCVRKILECDRTYMKRENHGFTKTLISYPIETYKVHQPTPLRGDVKVVDYDDLMFNHYRGHNKGKVTSEELQKIELAKSKDDAMIEFLNKHGVNLYNHKKQKIIIQ